MGLAALVLSLPTGTGAEEAASHCAQASPATTWPGQTPETPPPGETACVLHCTTLAQAVLAEPPAVADASSLLGAWAAASGAQADAGWCASPLVLGIHRGPPHRDLLLQISILRL